MNVTHRLTIWAMSLVLLLLGGCGGGGGGGDGAGAPPPPPAATTVSGTAATGAPLAGVRVTLKDSQGQSRTATTAANGTYSVDTSGLAPPFFIKAERSAGNLYSVSADANTTTTINITPLTDLIIRSWYNVQTIAVDTAFGAPATNPPPSPREVQLIASVVQKVVQLWLDQAGVSAGFNLISTPFSANSTGIDLVLDRTTVDPSLGRITIRDGTTTQVSTLAASGGAINVSTTTTSPSGTTSSTASTVVPVLSAQQQALADITAGLGRFAATVNTRGTALLAADVLPFFDPNLLDDGLNASQSAAGIAEFLKGVTLAFEVLEIRSLDTTNNVARVVVEIASTQAGATSREREEFTFRKVGSSWLLSGNGRIASVRLNAEARRDQGAHTFTVGPAINVHVTAPAGTVTGATVSGGGIWPNTALRAGLPSVEPWGNASNFFINSGVLPTLVPAGTEFTITLIRADGSRVSYVEPSNAFTTELISITSPTGSTLANATLGQPLNVSWTLPTTFPIQSIWLSAGGNTETSTCWTEGPVLGRTTTSAQITIPTLCANLAVRSVNLNLAVNGVNGERSHVIHFFR